MPQQPSSSSSGPAPPPPTYPSGINPIQLPTGSSPSAPPPESPSQEDQEYLKHKIPYSLEHINGLLIPYAHDWVKHLTPKQKEAHEANLLSLKNKKIESLRKIYNEVTKGG